MLIESRQKALQKCSLDLHLHFLWKRNHCFCDCCVCYATRPDHGWGNGSQHLNQPCSEVGYSRGGSGSSLLYPALLGLAQRIPGITALTDDLLLASLLAGGLIGIAVGMVMRVGGSTGGTDVLNLVLHKWFHLPVSAFVYLVDIMILGGQAIFSDPEQVLYGVVLLVTETIALDKIMLMGQSQVQLFVISDHFEEIRQKLLLKLHAGVTMMLIETGCTGTQQKGVLCVIPPRKLFAAKELIQSIDPDAFITVTQIKEVRGQGFTLERKDYFPPCQRDE